jgi:hypothetical protein
MSIDMARDALLWCTIINYGLLVWWFVVFILAHDWLHHFHGRWFQLSREQFDTVHYAGMALFKIGIILLNLVPYVALHIVA